MNAERVVVLELSRMEASHLAGLVEQFAELLDQTGSRRPNDPALRRLVPDAYADDDSAALEFRELTQRDLLDRRSTDAAAVLESLLEASALPDAMEHPAELERALTEVATVRLTPDAVGSWLRTLAALRLVLASRLGVSDEDDHDEDDPRFGIYDWLGFRLDGLVREIED
jgi:hypothetical protein